LGTKGHHRKCGKPLPKIIKQLSQINSSSLKCCPGYVDTDMTNHGGRLTIDQGAETPIWLATAPDVPNGAFVYLKKPKEWLNNGKIEFK
jgi:hypothetical protein